MRFITTALGLLLWRWIPYLCIWVCSCGWACVCVWWMMCIFLVPTTPPPPVCILIKVLQREAAIGLCWLHPRRLLIGIHWTCTNTGNNINGEWQEGRNNAEERRGEDSLVYSGLSFARHTFCFWTTSCSPTKTTNSKISWLEVTQGPKAVELTDSQLGSTGEIGHRAKNTLSMSLSFSRSPSPSCLCWKEKKERRQSKTDRKSK